MRKPYVGCQGRGSWPCLKVVDTFRSYQCILGLLSVAFKAAGRACGIEIVSDGLEVAEHVDNDKHKLASGEPRRYK